MKNETKNDQKLQIVKTGKDKSFSYYTTAHCIHVLKYKDVPHNVFNYHTMHGKLRYF